MRRTAAALAVAAVAALAGGAAGGAGAEEVSEADRQRWTCGHLGVPCPDEQADRLRLNVRPAGVVSGRRTRFVIHVTVGHERAAARGAVVRFAGRRLKTDRRGRAVTVRRFREPGARRIVARAANADPGRAKVVVRRAR